MDRPEPLRCPKTTRELARLTPTDGVRLAVPLVAADLPLVTSWLGRVNLYMQEKEQLNARFTCACPSCAEGRTHVSMTVDAEPGGLRLRIEKAGDKPLDRAISIVLDLEAQQRLRDRLNDAIRFTK